MKSVAIGGASGFWGDSFMAAPQLLTADRLDYLVFDYLAEITMSILAKAKAKDPEQGYALDFVEPTLKTILGTCAERRVRIISNAGGINPSACGRAVRKLVEQLGLSLHVAVVTGDDLFPRIDELRTVGIQEMSTGQPIPSSVMSANAYLGAFPIARALDQGADIVITGRCVDSAVTLGACIHEFGWKETDYDFLAGGSLAGHIIECGAQATGGLLTDWQRAGDWANIGYPIATVFEDGSFDITKPPRTGGLVCREGVAEQLVYEIGDPRAYVLPDVVCDFSNVLMEEPEPNRVRVHRAQGRAPTPTLKVCATYLEGYRLSCTLSIRGRHAAEKVQHTFDSVLRRVRAMLARRKAPDFTETAVEILGVESGYGPHAQKISAREVVGRLSAKHPAPEALGLLLRELTSAGTSMAPGTTGDGVHRPKPSPVVRLFSFLVDKSFVTPQVTIDAHTIDVPMTQGVPFTPPSEPVPVAASRSTEETTVAVPLFELAHGRSGDKGNDANIGIIARRKEFSELLERELTAERVAEYFTFLSPTRVVRYDLPGIGGWNFVLTNALGGGGIASLRQDPQGKALAQILLEIPINVPQRLLPLLPAGGP